MGPFRHCGHSTIEHAREFADAAGVCRLVLTHHALSRTDDALDEIAARQATTPGGIPVTVGRAAQTIQV